MAERSLQERIRARLREWCIDFTHQQIADSFHVNRSAVSKLFAENGSAITLDHLESFSFLLQRSPAEIVSEFGALIQSVTPIEGALLAIIRQMTELERRSLLTVLERPVAGQQRREKRARLGRAMLTGKEQELVDLFARVKKDGVRDGVLRTLRGAAQDDDHPAPVKPRTTG